MVAALGDVFRALARPDFRLPQVLQIVIERAVELCSADAGAAGTGSPLKERVPYLRLVIDNTRPAQI